jgi:hypothetical protein
MWFTIFLLVFTFSVDQSFAQKGTRLEDLGINKTEPGKLQKLQNTLERKFPVQRVPVTNGKLFPMGKLKESKVRHITRPRIAYKEFQYNEMRNPQTGQPLKPTDRITLKKKDGTTVTVSGAEYRASVNNYEQGFAQKGYSLRQKGEFQVQTSMLKSPEMLNMARDNFLKLYKPINTLPMLMKVYPVNTPGLNYAIMAKASLEFSRKMAPVIFQGLKDAQYANIKHEQIKDFSQTWEYKPALWGDDDTFGASVNADVTIEAKKGENKLKTSMMGNVKVYTFGQDWTVCDVNAKMDAPMTKSDEKMNGSLTVNILGESLVNWSESKSVQLEYKGHNEFLSIDKKVEFYYVIVVIPAKVGAGFRGSAGIRYDLYASPLYAHAKVVPYINTEAYAQCSITAVIASGGIEGKLILLNDTLDFGAIAKIDLEQPNPCFSFEYYGRNNIRTLDGALSVFAEVDLLLWSNKWKWDLFKWTGFSADGFVVKPERILVDLYTGQIKAESISKKMRLVIKRIEQNRKDTEGFKASFDAMPANDKGGNKFGPVQDRKAHNETSVSWNKTAKAFYPNTIVNNEIMMAGEHHAILNVALSCKDKGKKNFKGCGAHQLVYNFETKVFHPWDVNPKWTRNAGQTAEFDSDNIKWQYTIEEI